MNRNRLITLGVSLILIVIIFLGYGQIINHLRINPRIITYGGNGTMFSGSIEHQRFSIERILNILRP